MRSGRPRGPGTAFQKVGSEAPHIFEGFPGPWPDFKNAPPKSGQTAFRYPVYGRSSPAKAAFVHPCLIARLDHEVATTTTQFT